MTQAATAHIGDRLDELGRRAIELAAARAELETDMAGAIRAAIAAGMHRTEICARTGISRAWLYRRYGD